MQPAEATFPMAAAVSAPAVHRLRPTSNTLAVVVGNDVTLRRVQQALQQAGAGPDALDLMWGRAGLEQLAPAPRRRGLLAALRRRLGALGPDALLMERYRRELTHGYALILVRNLPRAMAERLRDPLVEAGGRCLQHYGRFSVAYLAV